MLLPGSQSAQSPASSFPLRSKSGPSESFCAAPELPQKPPPLLSPRKGISQNKPVFCCSNKHHPCLQATTNNGLTLAHSAKEHYAKWADKGKSCTAPMEHVPQPLTMRWPEPATSLHLTVRGVRKGAQEGEGRIWVRTSGQDSYHRLSHNRTIRSFSDPPRS